MGDISNKTLVALLVVAIAISLVGTWVSVSRISSIPVRVTGLQTQQQGITYLEVPYKTEIQLCVDLVNFTNGTVNTSGAGGNITYCEINTTCNQTPTSCGITTNNFNDCDWTGAKSSRCIGFTVPPSGFVVENTGNVRINLSMNSSNGGDWLDGPQGGDGNYTYRLVEENNACFDSNPVTSWTVMPTDNPVICKNMGHAGGYPTNNSVQIPIMVKIPSDLKGNKTDTVTFTATALE